MIEQDTIRLLRECDSGVKMGISSIGDVIGHVNSPELKKLLQDSSGQHERLGEELRRLLEEYKDEGKEPAAMAKGMSWLKTNIKLTADSSDGTIADLMTDGCDMGIKSLSKYLNMYQAADERSKDLAKRVISTEEELRKGVRDFL